MEVLESGKDLGEQNYITIQQDPELLLRLVNKYVEVKLIKNLTYTGFIHSIDPIKYSIILSVLRDNEYYTAILPGHSILSICEHNPPSNITQPTKKLPSCESQKDILSRKQKLMAWFKCNLLPVTENDGNIVFGNVLVLSPYEVIDICTDNPIVAMQVKRLIERMPLDFESK